MKYFFLVLVLVFALISSCTFKTNDDSSSEVDEDHYLRTGQEVAQATFQVLSNALSKALEKGGVQEAVHYCKLSAYPLVDSLSEAFQVDIRRTSDRYRNKSNAPSAIERAVITEYREAIQQQKIPSPKISIEEGTVHYYAPILLMDKCVKCHGVRDRDIDPSDYSLIQKLYPDDQAHGFKIGELRGIWNLTFEKE